MVITYFGKQFLKVGQGDLTIAVNPPSKDSGIKAPRFGADIALVSANIPEANGVDNLSFGEKMPFVIDGPGEYEMKEISIRGFQSEYKRKEQSKINTIYTIDIDGINLCFLGFLSKGEI